MGMPSVQIGIRSICKEEADLIKEKQLPVIRAQKPRSRIGWNERSPVLKRRECF